MIDKRIKYWNSLFPEIKDTDLIAKIVLVMTGKTMADYSQEYDTVQKDLCNWIKEKFFNHNSSQGEIIARYRGFVSQYRWMGFFVPILETYYVKYQGIIQNNQYIKDEIKFLKNFEDNLLDRMINMSFRVLVLETQIAKDEGDLIGDDEYQRGDFFCTHLLWNWNYVQDLYTVYPELIRLLDRVVQSTIAYLEEILEDYKEIFLHYGKLVSIIWGKGDLHNNGKTVAVLLCEKGKVVYKPRRMDMEKKYSELMRWLSQKNKQFLEFETAASHDLKFGGCMEFIENTECLSKEEVDKFYYRMGELLCVLYTLNSKDFHSENIIAHRDMPVPVDLETLVHLTVISSSEESIIYSANERISESVIGTALLPTLLQNSKTEAAIEIGGMGSGKRQKSPYKTQVLESFDTENVHIRFENKELNQTSNYPKYRGKIVSCANYLDTVKRGFRDVYRWICVNKVMYCEEVESLFSDLEARAICKSTNIYTQLLETGLHPDLLHNPYDRQIYLCRLGIIMEINQDYDNYQIYQCEFQDLKDGDVPYFSILCNSNKILYNSKEIQVKSRNKKSVIELIEFKIRNMGMTDLDRQIALINLSFIGSKLISDQSAATGNKFSKGHRVEELESPIEMGRKIGELCIARGCSVKIKNKTEITWIGMRGFGNGFYNISPVGFGMYQGNAGISLFFYHLGLKEKKYVKVFHNSFQAVYSNLFMELKTETCLENAGAFTGFMSEIYCIIYLLKRNENIINAQELKYIIDKSMTIVEKNIEKNSSLDLLSGVAGIIGVYLASIPCLDKNQQNTVVDFVASLVRSLKDSVITIEKGIYTWNDNNDIGYAHGNSGIITQLYKYYKISHDREIMELIRGAIEFERSYHFDQEKEQWVFKKNIHYYSWCNGIGGLLLTKLYLLSSGYEDTNLKSETFKLVEQLIETGFGTDLSICHGDMGSLQLLMYAANILKMDSLREECVNTYKDFANNFVNRSWTNINELEDWGLMAGITGVGMGFVADNKDIIDILLLE